MTPLRRHQLVWLDEFAWYRVLATTTATASSLPADSPAPESQAHALACLEHWAQQRWPLVVTRQAGDANAGPPDDVLALGLAAPACWGRQSISISASLRGVTQQGEFPLAIELVPELPAAAQVGWRLLCGRLAQLGVAARVYGSYGWQQITSMNYVHAASDIDLLIDVHTPAQADQAGALLRAADGESLRIDGELAFADGASVAWREWLNFRSGQAHSILVKRLSGVSMETAVSWAAAA
jgi:phosphoribosyl-dephospho-CoA transferase